MHVQIIHDGIDPLQISWHLGIDPTEKIQKVDLGTPWIALREAVPGRLPQRSEDVAFASTTVIQFLLRPLSRPFGAVDELRSLVAFGRDGSHFINVENGAVLRRL